IVVVALLGNAFAVSTPATTTTPSGLKYRVPPTVVSRSKLVSAQMGLVDEPGQTQWARSLTAWFAPQVASLGHTTLISSSVLACAVCPVTNGSAYVPRMNLGKTRTLPGCSESFSHAATGAAAGAATATFNSTSLTPGHAATGARGRAAAGATTPILSDTSNKLLSDFMLHAPFLIGPVRDRLCGAIGFPRCLLTGGRPDVSLVEASEWRIPDGPASKG